MTKFVVSKMSMSVTYNIYDKSKMSQPANANSRTIGHGALPIVKHKITIIGGAGLASHTSGFGEMERGEDGVPMWTAEGVVTPVSDANFEILKENHVFKKHQALGLIKVVNHDVTGNHKAVKKETASMAQDPFAPLTKYDAEKRIKITTGKHREDNTDFRL